MPAANPVANHDTVMVPPMHPADPVRAVMMPVVMTIIVVGVMERNRRQRRRDRRGGRRHTEAADCRCREHDREYFAEHKSFLRLRHARPPLIKAGAPL
jgi:hypothetical protein